MVAQSASGRQWCYSCSLRLPTWNGDRIVFAQMTKIRDLTLELCGPMPHWVIRTDDDEPWNLCSLYVSNIISFFIVIAFTLVTLHSFRNACGRQWWGSCTYVRYTF